MNKKSTIAAIVIAAALAGIFATSPLAYADESETSTDQENKQKNVGSGDSFNNNCAENTINSDTSDEDCTFNNQPIGDGGGDGERVTICHISASGVQTTKTLSENAAEAHLTRHDGPPGAGPDHVGPCI